MSEKRISPPDSPFHGFTADEVTTPGNSKAEQSSHPSYLDSPPDSPFHGFNSSDIPRPIFIKTEVVDEDENDVEVVEVVRLEEMKVIKEERMDVENDDDEEMFHGFSTSEIPLPIIIKEEPGDLVVERALNNSLDRDRKYGEDPEQDNIEVQDNVEVQDNAEVQDNVEVQDSVEIQEDTVVQESMVVNKTIIEAKEKPISPATRGQKKKVSESESVSRSPIKTRSPKKESSVGSKSPTKVTFQLPDKMDLSVNVKKDHHVPSTTSLSQNSLAGVQVSSEAVPVLIGDVQISPEEVHVSSVGGVQVFEQEVHVSIPESQVQETSILPDQLSLAYEECIEETITTSQESHIESSGIGRTNIIVRNETGFSEEKMLKNVLVLQGVGEGEVDEAGMQTSTIHIQEEEEDEDGEPILVMVDSENQNSNLHSGNLVFTNQQVVNRRSPMKESKREDFERITIIQTDNDAQTVKAINTEEINTTDRLPRNIQIIEQHGIGTEMLLVDKDSDTDSDMEDREFTVIVDEEPSDEEMDGMDEDEMVLDRIPLAGKNTFEGETIEDLLAQFETESKSRAVSCPNCKKCFVSTHFLNVHVSNRSTLCELCNTQCCTSTNLRNHKNLDCDLSKRKRNIDLIAQETALLGRKPIEAEKYYNMPLDSSDEEPDISPRKPVRSVNDQKYECGMCGQYVKILNSHMKYVHGIENTGLSTKYKCTECGVLVTNLSKHKEYRHNPSNRVVAPDTDLEVVRCKQPTCDMFFNNSDELIEHQKREHSDQVRLACGMGGCNSVFDSRGALRKHRSEAHPELEEFKPVDLEPDDPDRDVDLTVACPVCERKFKHKNTCTVHIKVHHLGWSKRKMFECPDCMKGFENKKNLDLHREAIHLGIRTICPLCDKPVTRLDLHVRMVHTELPEWPCPDCRKKFKRKFDLNRHRVTVHLGVRNFPCDLCGKRFADMKDMTRHKNAVHYGMKIKWNSKKHKEERKKKRELMVKKYKMGGGIQRDQQERLKNVNFPVEFIDTGAGGRISEEDASIDASSVILDPVLQSQLGTVQLIQADTDNSGSLRFVVLQEEMDDNGIEIEEEEEEEEEGEETHHIILEPED